MVTWCSKAVNRARLSWRAAIRTRYRPHDALVSLSVEGAGACTVFPSAGRLPSTASAGFVPLFGGFFGVGSEEARSVTLTLASVRRSNGACRFPALRFHKGTLHA